MEFRPVSRMEIQLSLSPVQQKRLEEEVNSIVNDQIYCNLYGINYLKVTRNDIERVKQEVYRKMFEKSD